jgi:hypothetical protein
MKPFVKLAYAAAIGIGGAIPAFHAASALPVAPLAASTPPLVEQVRWGCGPGWHPDPWGRCVPNWRGPGWYGRSGWYGGYPGWGWRRGGWHGGHGGWHGHRGWHGGHRGWHGGHRGW